MCLRYLFSRLGQSIVAPSGTVQWTVPGAKKPRLFSRGFLCLRYLFSRLGQSIVMPQQVSGGHLQALLHKVKIEKEPSRSLVLSVFALPIFTASHPATIVGVHVLNFCVRDGNRWTHMTINTNFLVTHTGFEPMLTA